MKNMIYLLIGLSRSWLGYAGYIKKYKFVDKNRALETAARVQKMLVDRVEVTGLDSLAEALAKARQRAK